MARTRTVNRHARGLGLVTGLLMAGLAWAGVAQGQAANQAQQDLRPRIGVSEVQILPSLAERLEAEGLTREVGLIAESLDSQLADRMHNTRRFRVVARQHLNAILEEQDLSPVVDPSQAPEQFRIDAVDYLVVTVIDHFEDRTQVQRFEAQNMDGVRRTVEVGGVVMLYHTQTGEQLESANVMVEETLASIDRVGRAGQPEAFNALGRDLGRAMSHKVANRVVDVIYPPRVVAVLDEEIVINRGDGTNIARGEQWTVYHRGQELIDPDLGISLGHAETRVGMAEVTRVEPMVAYARITENNGIEPGDMVRPAARSEDR